MDCSPGSAFPGDSRCEPFQHVGKGTAATKPDCINVSGRHRCIHSGVVAPTFPFRCEPLNQMKLYQRTLAPTIFHEDWWLNAASSGQWERVEVNQANSWASLSFIREQKFGASYLSMPPYTRTLGPVLSIPPSKPVTRAERMCSLMRELAGILPTYNVLAHKLPPGSEHIALACVLNGWACRTEFTFRIHPAECSHQSWDRMSQKTRNSIRSAQRRFEVEWHNDIVRLIALSLQEIESRGMVNRHRYTQLESSFSAALARGQAAALSAIKNGQDAAVVALVWDEEALYLWNTARHPTLAGAGALSLLIWEACKLAHERRLVMDFDGFGSLPSARFLRSFGGEPAPRPVISRVNAWLSTLLLLRDFTRPRDSGWPK